MRTILIVASIIGISAVIGAVIVGNKTFDGTVADKPYELGLSWDTIQKEREMSGWRVDILDPTSVRVGKNKLFVRVSDRSGQPLKGADIMLNISRPSSAFHDSAFKMIHAGTGRYSAAIDLPLYGYWNVRIQVAYGGRNINFDNTIFADKDR